MTSRRWATLALLWAIVLLALACRVVANKPRRAEPLLRAMETLARLGARVAARRGA